MKLTMCRSRKNYGNILEIDPIKFLEENKESCVQRECTLAEVIDVVVDTDLCWGGRLVEVNDKLYSISKVMGCIDLTYIEGTTVELFIFFKIVKEYNHGGRQRVCEALLLHMGLPYDKESRYDLTRLCTMFELQQGGHDPLSLLADAIIAPKVVLPSTIKELDSNLKQMRDDLDVDDGARNMITSAQFIN